MNKTPDSWTVSPIGRGHYRIDPRAKGNWVAYARLIAAAPELLEALNLVDSWARKNQLEPEVFEAVLGAIAKAEGGGE